MATNNRDSIVQGALYLRPDSPLPDRAPLAPASATIVPERYLRVRVADEASRHFRESQLE